MQTALTEHPQRLKEREAVDSVCRDLTIVSDSIGDVLQTLKSLPAPIIMDAESPEKAVVDEIFAGSQAIVAELRGQLESLNMAWRSSQIPVKRNVRTWRTRHREHLGRYAKAEEESQEAREKLKAIEMLQNQAAAMQREIGQLKADLQKYEEVRDGFNEAWATWTEKHSERGSLLAGACAGLTEKSAGEIKAEIQRGADIDGPLEELKAALTGCNITQDRWEKLREYLEADQGSPAKAWMKIMEQLRPLAELEDSDVSQGSTIPEVGDWDLTENMQRRIIQRLNPQQWLEIALISLRDKPVFFYCPNPNERIPFDSASAGQQATALLKVLLGESSGPLIIDQPEDDLDNCVIWEIAEAIWKAKECRQLIFSSHNANLVVNGDAELVVRFGYHDESERTKGKIVCEGAIDVREVREAITEVMEGGEKAFRLRYEKYGF
ncbi:MAG TPA: hypothetical protein PKH07_17125 [bacterium]|nr:hypothetical protein [bacterium]